MRSPILALLLLAACASPPPPPALDLSRERASPNGQFRITLLPPADVPLHAIHRWQVKVADAAGAPLGGALVYLAGGMPEHGHGLPTRPRVTGEPVPGTYVVDGVKFNMAGWWEIHVAVQKGPLSDVTTFNYLVALPR